MLKSRARKTAMEETRDTTPMNKRVIRPIPDFRIPRTMWSIENDLNRSLSTLPKIMMIQNKMQSIIKQQERNAQILKEEKLKLQSEFNKKMEVYRSELEYEEQIKESEFKKQRETIIDDTAKKRTNALESLNSNKNSILKAFNGKQTSEVNELENAIKEVSSILNKYEISEENQGTAIPMEDKGQTVAQLVASAYKIDEYLDSLVNKEDIVASKFNKFLGDDEETRNKRKIQTALAAVIAAPITIMGTAGAIAVTLNVDMKTKKEIARVGEGLIKMKVLLENKLISVESRVKPDVTNIDKEYETLINSSQRQQELAIEDLERERNEWLISMEEKKAKDIESELKHEAQEKATELVERFSRDDEVLRNSLAEEKQKNDLIRQSFERENTRSDMYDLTNQDFYKRTDILVKILQKYVELDNYEKLYYNHLPATKKLNEERGITITEEKEEYDRELYRDNYIPAKLKIYLLEHNKIIPAQFKHVKILPGEIELLEKEERTIGTLKYEVGGGDPSQMVDLGTLPDYIEDAKKSREYYQKLLDSWKQKADFIYLLNTNKFDLGNLVNDEKLKELSLNEVAWGENLNNGSIIMLYETLEEERVLINYVKNFVQQAINSLHPDSLQVNILNPTSDTSFNNILIDTTHDEGKKRPKYVDTYEPADMDSVENSVLRILRERQYGDLSKGDTLSQVIKRKRAEGSKTPKWIINVLHRVDASHPFHILSENSQTTGILNIVMLNKKDLLEEKEAKDPSMLGTYELNSVYENTVSKSTNLLVVEKMINPTTAQLVYYNRESESFREISYELVSDEETKKRTKHYRDRFHSNLKETTTTMGDEFIMQVTDGKFWTKSAHKGLDMYVGYLNGDKTKAIPIKFDETSAVHAIIGGTTGGGKSVFLQLIANTMKANYSPEELNVYYYDFKQVEVALHSKPYKWPNAKALAGSSAGEYFISLLQKLDAMMATRYSLMKKAGINKLSNYREFLAGRKVDFYIEVCKILNEEPNLKGKKMDLLKHVQEHRHEVFDKILEMPEGAEKEQALKLRNLYEKIIIPPRIVVIIDEVQEGFKIDDETTEQLKKTLDSISKVARAAGLHMILLTQDPGATIPETVLKLFTLKFCTVASPSISKTIIGNDFCARPENQFMGFVGANLAQDGNEDANMQFLVPFAMEEHAKLYSKLTEDLIRDGFQEQKAVPVVVFDQDEVFTFDDLERYHNKFIIEPNQIILGEKVEFQTVEKPSMITQLKDTAQGIVYVSAEKHLKQNFYQTLMESLNRNKVPTMILHGKQKNEDYDIGLIENTIFKKSRIRYKPTGEVIDPEVLEDVKRLQEMIGDNLQEMKDKMLEELESKRDTMTTEERVIEIERISEMTNEDLIEDTDAYPIYEYHSEHYEKSKSAYGRNGEEMDFIGRILESMEIGIQRQKHMAEIGKPYTPIQLIVIDPEKDSEVKINRQWNDGTFQGKVNEAMEYGVYMTVITSDFELLLSKPWVRYVIGRKAGADANQHKHFKKLNEPFSLCFDIVSPDKSFLIKMPGKAGEGGDNHLFGIED